jgi:hypothetical protein
MATQTIRIDSPVGESTELEIELKDRRLAAFLAWLVPGLGHIYQGRTGKGVLFFVCIVGTFLYGLYLGDGRVVYASTADVFSRGFLDRWQYICQVGVGLPALPAVVQRQRVRNNKPPLFDDFDKFMRPPSTIGDFRSTDGSDNEVRHPDELAKWHHDIGDMFEMGTVYTVIAGLLNLLVIFDAYGGPLVFAPPEDKKKSPDDDGKDAGKRAEESS